MRHQHLDLAAWNKRPWLSSTWRGWPCLQTPVDLQLMQELIDRVKPELIVETGTHCGGHALFMRDMQNLTGVHDGKVISIGLPNNYEKPQASGLHFIESRSTESAAVQAAKNAADSCSTVMVVLDSDHSATSVLKELFAFAGLVTPGSYLIACDGTAVRGPKDAVSKFLQWNKSFMIDRRIDRFGLSNHEDGWLKKSE